MRITNLPEISIILKSHDSVGSLNNWLNTTKVFHRENKYVFNQQRK